MEDKLEYVIDGEFLADLMDDRIYLAAILDTVEFTEEQLKIIDELYEKYYIEFANVVEEENDDSGHTA